MISRRLVGGFRLLSLAVLIVFVVGCSDGLASVSGTVKLDGKAVTSGTVIMIGNDKVARTGTINPDGTYLVEGLVAGTVKIAINSPNPTTMDRADPKSGQGGRGSKGGGRGDSKMGVATPAKPPTDWVPIPQKYADPETTTLSTTLKSGEKCLRDSSSEELSCDESRVFS